MSAQTAPYNDSMRIGSGFNSYTQQLRVNDAVVKENKTAVTDKDLKAKLTGRSAAVSQQVTFTSKFVEHASDITEALNISGALEIKYQGMGAKASGSYLDSSKVKESDINYFVQVKVVNQQLIADDATKFNVIPNIPVTDQQRFTEVYGDSYISGFLEGGEFNALLSIKLNNKENATEIKGALSVELSKAGFGISGQAEGSYSKSDIAKNSETSITVSWAGGGDIRDEKSKVEGWTIDSMAKAAFSFPDRVRQTPQRTHAVLTKYSALRSYQLLSNKGSPLDYENAGVYTNSLLESYLDYKEIWKTIGILGADYGQRKTNLKASATAKDTAKDIKEMKKEFNEISSKLKEDKPVQFSHIPEAPYPGTLVGLEKARRDCRSQMIRIVKEVDAVAEDPMVATDLNRVGIYLSPLLFRQLLPIPELQLTEEDIRKEEASIVTLEEDVQELKKQVAEIKEKHMIAQNTLYSIRTAQEPIYWLTVEKKPSGEHVPKAVKDPEALTYWTFSFSGETPNHSAILHQFSDQLLKNDDPEVTVKRVTDNLGNYMIGFFWKIERYSSCYTIVSKDKHSKSLWVSESGKIGVQNQTRVGKMQWCIEKKPEEP